MKIPIAHGISSDGKSIWKSPQTIETRDMTQDPDSLIPKLGDEVEGVIVALHLSAEELQEILGLGEGYTDVIGKQPGDRVNDIKVRIYVT